MESNRPGVFDVGGLVLVTKGSGAGAEEGLSGVGANGGSGVWCKVQSHLLLATI